MTAWRIVKKKYAQKEQLLSGDGAKTVSGRWNRAGIPVVYASSSSSLALLETLVHASVSLLPPSLVAVPIAIPDDERAERISISNLPETWRDANDPSCAEIGSAWLLARSSLVLRVPSAVNPLEENILLNPAHHGIVRCTVGNPIPVEFDSRLLALFKSS